MVHTASIEAAMPRVLIVEDEALIRLALGDFLESSGFRVIEASTGDQAAQILERGGPPIDLVFSDVRMPGTMDGLKLASWIRERHPELPVFLASGDIGKAHTSSDLAPGQPFFPKPYDMNFVACQMRATLQGLTQRAV